GVVAVVLINLMGGQALMGARGGHTYSLGAVVTQLASTLGGYLLGVRAGVGADQALGAFVLAGFVVGLGFGAVRLGRQPLATWASPALPTTAFVVAYGAFLALSEMTTMLNPVDSRLMAPMFAPLVVLAALMVAPTRAWIAERLASRTAPQARRVPTIAGRPAFGAIAVVVLLLGMGSIGAGTGSWARRAGDDGIRLNEISRRGRPWVELVTGLPPGAAVVTDDPYTVAWLSAHEPVTSVPGRRAYTWEPFDKRLRQVRQFVVDHDGGYLILFKSRGGRVIDSLRWVGIDVVPYASAAGVALYSLRVPPPTVAAPPPASIPARPPS
ncbi:MAG TPA: hypothetical protein VGM93_13470, partial [Acidimicrobiales bacterium]